MKYERLLLLAGGLPVIETETLRAWSPEPRALSVQLSRWVRQGKLVQLRRGKYMLPEALRRPTPPLEHVANLLVTPSYVSLERALAYHGLIPERVPLLQSVTPGRPALFKTDVGDFKYHHVKRDWFFGYAEVPVSEGSALIATPEKALLDLVHLLPGSRSLDWLQSLRLQELHRLDLRRMRALTRGHGRRLELAGRELVAWLEKERQ